MDAQQPWGDFHFLNAAFADVVAASVSTGQQTQWIRPPLVRFSTGITAIEIETRP